MNKQLSIDELLGRIYVEDGLSIEEAKEALLEYMESKAPKKIRSNSAFVQVANPVMREFRQAEANGFNEAIKQYKSNLRGDK